MTRYLDEARQDLRIALRLMLRRPGFTAAGLATLALGIGATTAIFSVVYGVLLRPLPYAEPDRVVQFLMQIRTASGPRTIDAMPVAEALRWRDSAATLSSLAVYNSRSLTLVTENGPQRLVGATASPDFFEVLKSAPMIGRSLGESVTTQDARIVVLSYATWRRYFAGDPAIVGRMVPFDGVEHRIVGVMADDFAFPDRDTAFWVPFLPAPGSGRGMLLPGIGRLRDGVSIADVRREGTAMLTSPGQPADQRAEIDVVTLREQIVGSVRQALWTLMAAVAAVLLVAVVNIALLLLTRGATRARELSVRMALGAGRGRVLRQLFVESAVLGAAGGIAGAVFATVALRALLASAPASLPRAHEIGLDLPTLVCALALSVAASLGFGVLSAGRTLEIDLRAALGGGSARLGSLTRGLSNRLHLLAAAEMALTMVLLVVAGLLIRSFVRIATLDPGYSPRGVLAFQINLPANRYQDAVARVSLGETLLTRIRGLGPVEKAGMTVALPNRQSGANFAFVAEGETFTFDPTTMQTAETRTVTDGFFETMGMPIVAGRAFTIADDARTEDVCIVSEGVVRKYLRGREPIGLRIVYPQGGGARIVGVVPDVRPATAGAEPKLGLYLPMRQNAPMFDWQTSLHFVVRAKDPVALVPEIRRLAAALDPVMPVYNVRTLDAELAEIVAAPRFNALVLSLFAGVALALACVGTYGVFAYVVSQRTLEIGIRTALGATSSQVLWLVLRRGGAALAAGALIGLLASLAIGRLLASQLFELSSADPATLAGTATILIGFGWIATWLPARRALRIKPLDALREI